MFHFNIDGRYVIFLSHTSFSQFSFLSPFCSFFSNVNIVSPKLHIRDEQTPTLALSRAHNPALTKSATHRNSHARNPYQIRSYQTHNSSEFQFPSTMLLQKIKKLLATHQPSIVPNTFFQPLSANPRGTRSISKNPAVVSNQTAPPI